MYPICMKQSVPGPIIPENPNPTLPPEANEFCEYGWHFLKDGQKCVYFGFEEKSFQASNEICIGKGGILGSVNSPGEQAELTSLAKLDPEALGDFKLKHIY